jgi:capsule polysaccharide modification protein KpsS
MEFIIISLIVGILIILAAVLWNTFGPRYLKHLKAKEAEKDAKRQEYFKRLAEQTRINAEKRQKQIEENDKHAATMRQKKSQIQTQLDANHLLAQRSVRARPQETLMEAAMRQANESPVRKIMGPIERQMYELEQRRMQAQLEAEERVLRMQNPSYDEFKRRKEAEQSLKTIADLAGCYNELLQAKPTKIKGKAYQNPITLKWEVYQGEDE